MSTYIDKAVEGELARVRGASEGGRNSACNKAAYHLGRLVEAGGLDPDEIADLLLEAAYFAYATSSEEAKPGLRNELVATIASGLRAGQQKPRVIDADYRDREQGLHDVLDEVEDHQKTFLSHPHKGLKANRMVALMTAIYVMAIEQATTKDIRVTYNRARVYAGVGSPNTISHAFKDLIEAGYLERTSRATASTGAAYRLRLPPYAQGCSTPPPHPGVQEHYTFAHPGHDAFQRKALGRTGQRIVGFLERHPTQWFTQAEVARKVGIVTSTVNRHVHPERSLVAHGLIERDNRGHIRLCAAPTMEILETVAFDKRTAGIGDRRRRSIARYLQQTGWLTNDLYWIVQTTGTPTHRRADWLVPTRTSSSRAERANETDVGIPTPHVEDVA